MKPHPATRFHRLISCRPRRDGVFQQSPKTGILAAFLACATVTATVPALSADSQPALLTPLEQADHQKWTRHEQVVEFLHELDAASPLITRHLLGASEEGREIHYAQVTSDETFASDENKLTVLVFGQQHGSEPSGNEAILSILRDLAAGERPDWLVRMDLLFVPQVNPDGAEILERRNARDIDLNRSHLVLDGKEVRHLRELFHQWEPEATLDVHEYRPWMDSWMRHGYIPWFDEQYGLPTNLNVSPAIRDLGEHAFLPRIAAHLEGAGFTFHNYLVGDPDSLRHSTTNINDGRQGLAILGTFSLILEGRRHRDDLGGIARRTAAQVSAIEGLLDFLADTKDQVKRTVAEARRQLRDGEAEEIVLSMSRQRGDRPLRLPVREVHRDRDREFRKGGLIEAEIENYHPLVVAERSTALPEAYLVPAAEEGLIELLRAHRVEHTVLEAGETFPVERFRIEGFQKELFETPMLIPGGALHRGEYTAAAGDLLVPVAQLRGLMVATALEPQSMHGLIQHPRFAHLKKEGDFPVLRVVKGEKGEP